MKVILGLILLCSFIGCGGDRSIPTPSVAGNWKFTGHSIVSGQDITGSATIQQKGSSVTGGVNTVNGSTCASTQKSSGSITGTAITIQIPLGNQVINVTGTINPAGDAASGSYTGGCTTGDYGTWSADKTS